MSELVAAFASSHSIMLTCRLEDWQGKFAVLDARITYYDRQGEPCSYADLLARAPENAGDLITNDAIAARFATVQDAMARMKAAIAEAKLDVLIVTGDDQYELFKYNLMPAIAIYYGKTIRNAVRKEPPSGDWFAMARMRRLEDHEDAHYPVNQALALHLIEGLIGRGFDITTLRGLEENQFEGHAFSFVHRIYGVTTPIVPVMLNTFYPPNPPLPARCVALGEAIGALIESFPGDLRVGIFASGGLSHFQAEEDLDNAVIAALHRRDLDFLARLDPRRLQSGSSEIRNWLIIAAAARALDLDWVSYTPAYRTPALTGTGLGFAAWHRPNER